VLECAISVHKGLSIDLLVKLLRQVLLRSYQVLAPGSSIQLQDLDLLPDSLSSIRFGDAPRLPPSPLVGVPCVGNGSMVPSLLDTSRYSGGSSLTEWSPWQPPAPVPPKLPCGKGILCSSSLGMVEGSALTEWIRGRAQVPADDRKVPCGEGISCSHVCGGEDSTVPSLCLLWESTSTSMWGHPRGSAPPDTWGVPCGEGISCASVCGGGDPLSPSPCLLRGLSSSTVTSSTRTTDSSPWVLPPSPALLASVDLHFRSGFRVPSWKVLRQSRRRESVVCFDDPRLRQRGASVASPFPTVSRLLGGLFLLWLLLLVASELVLAYWRGLLADSVLLGLYSLSVLVPAFPWGAHCGARRWDSPPCGENEPSVPSPLLPGCPVGLSLPTVAVPPSSAEASPSVPLRFPAPRASASDPLPLDTRLLGGLLPLLLLLHLASVSRLLGGLLLLWLLLLAVSESGLAYPVSQLVDCVPRGLFPLVLLALANSGGPSCGKGCCSPLTTPPPYPQAVPRGSPSLLGWSRPARRSALPLNPCALSCPLLWSLHCESGLSTDPSHRRLHVGLGGVRWSLGPLLPACSGASPRWRLPPRPRAYCTRGTLSPLAAATCSLETRGGLLQ
jgi:hypothetical protein